MKKIITTFVLISLSKGVLLYLIILLGKLISSFPGIIRFFVLIFLLGLIDWKAFSIISASYKKWEWIKLCVFSFVTFNTVLFTTRLLFEIHNEVFDIQPKGNGTMPNLIPFFILGLIISVITTTIWSKKKTKKIADSV